jgi:hypothetical protein
MTEEQTSAVAPPDGAEMIFQALMHRFDMQGDDVLPSNPIVLALECAAYVTATGAAFQDIPDAVDAYMPPNATSLERGMALGVSMMVVTEPDDANHRLA